MQTVDFVILCALPDEARAALTRFESISTEDLSGWICHFARFRNLTDGQTYSLAIIELGEMGNLASLAASSTAIRELSPTTIFLLGICGGLLHAKDFRLGDVIVADRIAYYEPAKLCAERNEQRGREFPCPAHWTNAAKETAAGSWTASDSIATPRPADSNARVRPAFKCGTVCSGEKVITDPKFTAQLLNYWPNAVSVEMEAAGVAYACQGTDVGFLVVKAVSDFADAAKNDQYRKYACATAASFLKCLLEHSALPPTPRLCTNEVPLGDLFGFNKRSQVRVILPSYNNPRHANCGVANYPYNLWESAFDDVYSALRIMPALEMWCRRGNVQFGFDLEPHLPHTPNTILIGSSISNQHTRDALSEGYFRFGVKEQDHDIVDTSGNTLYASQYQFTGIPQATKSGLDPSDSRRI